MGAGKRRRALEITLAILVVLGIGALLLGTGVFVVRTVTVQGTESFTPEQVIQLSGIRDRQSIFTVSAEGIQTQFARNRYLVLDAMQINYPNELVLHVHERKPRAAITRLGRLALLDEEGWILELDREMAEGIPLITGVDAVALVAGQPINSRIPAQVTGLRTILHELILQAVIDHIEEINLANVDNLYLMTRSGMKVELGTADDMESKIGMMRGTLTELAKEGIYSGTLDVAIVSVADYQASKVYRYEFVPDPTAPM